ncbi:MAG: YggT family protein [bacterium]
MFIFSNLFLALARLLDIVITLYIWIVIIRVVISWVNPDPSSPIVQFLIRVTEPVLSRIRRYVPYLGGLDISPMILIFGLYIVEIFLVRTFQDLAYSLR